MPGGTLGHVAPDLATDERMGMRVIATLLATGAVWLAVPQGPEPGRSLQSADSLYALVYTRGPSWEDANTVGQQSGMREHSANLSRLRTEGRIVLGGRFGDYGLIVLRVRDRADALALLGPDSATARGVFRAELSPWFTIYEGSVPPR